jgi:hypothetical protein
MYGHLKTFGKACFSNVLRSLLTMFIIFANPSTTSHTKKSIGHLRSFAQATGSSFHETGCLLSLDGRFDFICGFNLELLRLNLDFCCEGMTSEKLGEDGDMYRKYLECAAKELDDVEIRAVFLIGETIGSPGHFLLDARFGCRANSSSSPGKFVKGSRRVGCRQKRMCRPVSTVMILLSVFVSHPPLQTSMKDSFDSLNSETSPGMSVS